jgi:hypothetical protein
MATRFGRIGMRSRVLLWGGAVTWSEARPAWSTSSPLTHRRSSGIGFADHAECGCLGWRRAGGEAGLTRGEPLRVPVGLRMQRVNRDNALASWSLRHLTVRPSPYRTIRTATGRHCGFPTSCSRYRAVFQAHPRHPNLEEKPRMRIPSIRGESGGQYQLSFSGCRGARCEEHPPGGYPASRLRTGDPLPGFAQWVMRW